ncbi:UNVERIFIED_CONTAM: hypothetical protein PYX00_000542 [Menopon gallinae]|uniref:Beta-galactoside alpha-2,6-sialyltransferase 1 n=1 Tax=Menopon gallinae TaxID=328185 RepID=A0AAW2I9Q9_9NEOP
MPEADMRAVAISIWVFFNLGFLGMCGYIYLVFSQYWYNERNHDFARQMVHRKPKFDREHQVVFYQPEGNENGSLEKRALDRPKRSHPRNKIPEKVPCKGNCSGQKSEKTLANFKDDVFLKMRRVLHDESNVFKTDNPYFVNYKGRRTSFTSLGPKELKCRLKKVRVRTLKRQDPPFNRVEFGNIIGERGFLDNTMFNSCAIVSNAGSLLNSRLGAHIDSHDAVLRFNHAPTVDYEEDVGKKTTIRIVNSQVVTKEKFKFTTSPLYKNVTLVVWDPSNYTASLQQWYEKPDFDFFGSWARQRLSNPGQQSFILDPRSVWKVWDFIQSLTPLRIRRNPPSSGFLGIALMLPHCDTLDVYEYVPSVRLTDRCHYFDDFEDSSCTFGVWHPLAAEKMLSLGMNEANDTTVFLTGFIRIRGYRNLKC